MDKVQELLDLQKNRIDDLRRAKETLELLTPEEQKSVAHSIMTIYSVNHGPKDQEAG